MSSTYPRRVASGRLSRTRRLRQLLILDAVFYTTSGMAYLLAGGPLEFLLGVDAQLIRPVGAFLVAAGLAVAVLARQTEISPEASLTIVTANIVWGVGTLLVLVLGALSPTLLGGFWIAVQAVAAGVLAAAQNWARRLT